MPTQFEEQQIYIRANASSSSIMGNDIQVRYLIGTTDAALLLAGCGSGSELTSADQNMRSVQEKPGAEYQLLGTTTGKQSNWLSGQSGDEDDSICGAANALRNQAAAMGGNVIHGVNSPTQSLLSSFIPTDGEMNGQVYKCPN